MKIAVLTIDNPTDKRAWSGILSKLFKELQTKYGQGNVYNIGPLRSFGVKFFLSVFNYILLKTFKIRYNYSHSFILSLIYSFQVGKKLKIHNIDLIFAIGSTNAFAFFKNSSGLPIILFTDATFESLNNYYFKNLCRFSVFESNIVEKLALSKCDHIIFASKWANNEANQFYGINEHSSSSIIKFGSNLNNCFERLDFSNEKKEFNLLFVGVDWERKGGDIILGAFNLLLLRGYKLTLTIVGCLPPVKIPKSIKVIPFLDKNKLDDLIMLEDLYKTADIFVLPTRAECSAIVFSEASSFGLPIISTKTGGVECYVENGLTGYLFETGASHEIFANGILDLINDRELYRSFSTNSFKKFLIELNWGRFISDLDSVFLYTLKQEKS
jgi:glycosyltransferase involved in cell wall biosynthesis